MELERYTPRLCPTQFCSRREGTGLPLVFGGGLTIGQERDGLTVARGVTRKLAWRSSGG
jgi:hypothetical protein